MVLSTRPAANASSSAARWNDALFTFNDAYTQPPLNRSAANGIRLVTYPRDEPGLAAAQRTTAARVARLPAGASGCRRRLRRLPADVPVRPDAAQRQGAGDGRGGRLDPRTGAHERRVRRRHPARVPLSAKASGRKPWPAVVYFPPGAAIHQVAPQNLQLRSIDFVVRSGRAVLYPVYKGTYQRRDSLKNDTQDTTNFWRDHVVMWAKDMRRGIDYLETRPDVDTGAPRVLRAQLGWRAGRAAAGGGTANQGECAGGGRPRFPADATRGGSAQFPAADHDTHPDDQRALRLLLSSRKLAGADVPPAGHPARRQAARRGGGKPRRAARPAHPGGPLLARQVPAPARVLLASQQSTAALPSTSHAELIRQRTSAKRLAAASTSVRPSTMAARPSCTVTTAIRASDAALTPSRTAPAAGDCRTRGTSGPLIATKKKAGRKMPSVATAAPGTRASR